MLDLASKNDDWLIDKVRVKLAKVECLCGRTYFYPLNRRFSNIYRGDFGEGCQSDGLMDTWLVLGVCYFIAYLASK